MPAIRSEKPEVCTGCLQLKRVSVFYEVDERGAYQPKHYPTGEPMRACRDCIARAVERARAMENPTDLFTPARTQREALEIVWQEVLSGAYAAE